MVGLLFGGGGGGEVVVKVIEGLKTQSFGCVEGAYILGYSGVEWRARCSRFRPT
jgi:hypothetical protein